MNPLSALSPVMSNSGMLPMPGLDPQGLSTAGLNPQSMSLGGLNPLSMAGSTKGIPSIGGAEGSSLGANLSPLRSASGPDSFSGMLKNFVSEVNTKQVAASDAVRDLQSGGNTSLHETMIAMEEASLSFSLMIEVRNKLQESYQEIMRMQV